MKISSCLKRLLCPSLAALLLCGCGGMDFDVYYNAECLTTAPLPKGQRPRLIHSLKLEEVLARYQAEGYRIIGSMNFSSERVADKDVVDYAASKGASLVLGNSVRTGSQEKRYVVPVTNTSTTYHSGTISSFGSPGYNVSGTSTTTQTSFRQYSYSVGRYEYRFFFLAR